MSQALRKMTGAISNTGTTVIFINQLREKIGVMFGCFDYDTKIVLADGTTEKIGKIVNEKMDIEVLSYDPDQDRLFRKGRELVQTTVRTNQFLHIDSGEQRASRSWRRTCHAGCDQ